MDEREQQKLDNLRHSCAHLLAAAVLELWPEAKPTLGPPIENGFYYDFDFGEVKVSTDDLPAIEDKMRELMKDWKEFNREEVSREQALERYAGNEYKQELINQFSEEGQTLTLYTCGGFIDLCRGGHCLRPYKELKHFKLLSVAGAYWRGDEKNAMLSRIYGTCFAKAAELEAYLEQLEEAKKRDHRRLGVELDLFTFSDLVGSGLPLWTPRGALLRNILDDFVWELRQARGYQKVEIPHITKKDLYEKSGHWDKFSEELFKIETREGHVFAMKPMNCPHHTQIFDRKPHSYKEMPQRYANTTMVYRDEQTGELSGLSRVRSITQDDAHVFCRRSQMKDELNAVSDIIEAFYAPVGFELYVRLSRRDPEHPEKYLGEARNWDEAEAVLKELADSRGIRVIDGPGEAAFYGPKLDYMAKDSLGREWQVATNQLDLNMPNRFGLSCINEDGEKESIVMIHAAIMGSIERYMSILIEHFGGAFPTWLSPVQVKVLPITDDQIEYARLIAGKLRDSNVRVEVDDRSQTLNAKIRDAQMEKVPYMLVVGGQEAEKGTVTVRTRSGEQVRDMELECFTDQFKAEVNERQLELSIH